MSASLTSLFTHTHLSSCSHAPLRHAYREWTHHVLASDNVDRHRQYAGTRPVRVSSADNFCHPTFSAWDSSYRLDYTRRRPAARVTRSYVPYRTYSGDGGWYSGHDRWVEDEGTKMVGGDHLSVREADIGTPRTVVGRSWVRAPYDMCGYDTARTSRLWTRPFWSGSHNDLFF